MTTTSPTALITGASAGLGRALATALAERGWTLVLDARGADRLAEVATGLARVTTVEAVAGSVTDRAHRAELAAAVRFHGPLDLLVHNASELGGSPQPRLGDLDPQTFETVLQTNVVAPAALTRQLLPDLVAAHGTVLAISSDAAVEHYEGWGAYGASKAALDHHVGRPARVPRHPEGRGAAAGRAAGPPRRRPLPRHRTVPAPRRRARRQHLGHRGRRGRRVVAAPRGPRGPPGDTAGLGPRRSRGRELGRRAAECAGGRVAGPGRPARRAGAPRRRSRRHVGRRLPRAGVVPDGARQPVVARVGHRGPGRADSARGPSDRLRLPRPPLPVAGLPDGLLPRSGKRRDAQRRAAVHQPAGHPAGPVGCARGAGPPPYGRLIPGRRRVTAARAVRGHGRHGCAGQRGPVPGRPGGGGRDHRDPRDRVGGRGRRAG